MSDEEIMGMATCGRFYAAWDSTRKAVSDGTKIQLREWSQGRQVHD